jgi:hypothetical protein
MAYDLYEYLPNQVLYAVVRGEFTPIDLYTINQTVTTYMDNATNPIHHIIDYRYMTDYPKNVFQLARTFRLFVHPNHAMQYVITQDPQIEFISTTVVQMVKGRRDVIAVRTPDEVVTHLRHQLRLAVLPPLPDDDSPRLAFS